jgi:DNA-binding LacI/PurR family transcriptional regulator
MDPETPSNANSAQAKAAVRFLHRSVSDALRRKLTAGQLPGGAKLPALKLLANELAVSTMTIRRAIRTLEREGHLYHINGVGTFVRQKTPASATARKVYAFVGSDLSSPFQTAIARGAQRLCQQRGWAMQMLDAHWDAQLEAENIRLLPESGVSGAILLPPFSDAKAIGTLFSIQSADFPLVLADMAAPGLKADLVCSDHESGAYMATQYLLEHGHRQIVMLTHPAVASSVAARISGYERALLDHGILASEEWKAWVDLAIHQAGYRQGKKWLGGCQAILPLLQRLKPPVAVLAIDAYVGWGVYEACHALGLSVPEDVSVVAFDDCEAAHALRPPMTIISQRTDEIGRIALELLDRRVEASTPGKANRREFTQVFVDVDLIERGSVGRIPAIE